MPDNEAAGVQVNVPVLDPTPESFDEQGVEPPAAPIHSDRHVVLLEELGELGTREQGGFNPSLQHFILGDVKWKRGRGGQTESCMEDKVAGVAFGSGMRIVHRYSKATWARSEDS